MKNPSVVLPLIAVFTCRRMGSGWWWPERTLTHIKPILSVKYFAPVSGRSFLLANSESTILLRKTTAGRFLVFDTGDRALLLLGLAHAGLLVLFV